MLAAMPLEWITAAAAVVAACGGLYLLYRAWYDRRRLDVTLISAFQPDPDELTSNASIRIFNPTSNPILVEGAGFRLKSGTRIKYDGNAHGHSGTQHLSYRLQSHEPMTLSMEMLLLVPEANGGEEVTQAYVEWAGHKPTTQKVPADWVNRWAAAKAEADRRR